MAPAATPVIKVLGLPTRFIPHAKPDVILAKLGLDAAGIEQGRDHRRRRRLAVRTRDGDGPFEADEFGEHVGPAHYRTFFAKCRELGLPVVAHRWPLASRSTRAPPG